jgi:hypothetical protein
VSYARFSPHHPRLLLLTSEPEALAPPLPIHTAEYSSYSLSGAFREDVPVSSFGGVSR